MFKKFNGLKILYGFLVIGCMVYAQDKGTKKEAAKASFTFDSKEHNYGNIPENGGIAEHVFVITNTGTKPLVIIQAVTSCGCTVSDWTKTPIAPKGTGTVNVLFDPQGKSGEFANTITVHIDNYPEDLQLIIRGNVTESTAEKLPILTFFEVEFDFGTIGENDGYAEHTFRFKNTGTAPLVVPNVQVSCGCTSPEWTRAPIAPGQTGDIILIYDPRGRLGNFNRSATVYTNEDNGYKRYKLTISGTVVEKPMDPRVKYVDTIGGVGLEQKDLIYSIFTLNRENTKVFYLKNYNLETVYFSWENVPEHITVSCPDSLKGEWPGEVRVTIDGKKTMNKRGRITDNLSFKVKNNNGKILGEGTLTATANYIDDFNQMSPLESVNAPRLDIQNTMIDFGKIKSGFLGMGGNAVKEIVLTNIGKSDLKIHSLTCEDKRVKLPEIKGKIIAAGASLPVKATIKAKDIKSADIDTDIHVICNDPRGPVRLIKITAQKEK